MDGHTTYLGRKSDARIVAEAAAVGVVGTALFSLGNGFVTSPVVAVKGVPDNLTAGQNIAVILIGRAEKTCLQGEIARQKSMQLHVLNSELHESIML